MMKKFRIKFTIAGELKQWKFKGSQLHELT